MKEFTEIIDFPEKLHEAYKIKIGRKGAKKTSGGGKEFRQPTKDDHFEVRLNERDANGDLKVAKDIMIDLVRYNAERKGLKNIDPKKESNYNIVTEIPVRLLYDDIPASFSYKYALHQGRKIQCHGNGRDFVWHPNMDDQVEGIHKDGKTCKDCKNYKAKKCKYNLRLICYLEFMPELGSVAVFRSTGFNSIRNINTSLKTIQKAANGILAGLPLVLTVSPQEGTYEDGGKDKITTIYAVNIVFRPPPMALVKGKKPLLEIGTEVGREAIQIAAVRETNKQAWDKMKATAEEVRVAITDEESEEQNMEDTELEFYPENVQEEIAEENQDAAQDEENIKIAVLDDAKKRLFAAGKNVKTVNQWVAMMRSKSLKEIKAWYRKTLRLDPDKITVEVEQDLENPAMVKASEKVAVPETSKKIEPLEVTEEPEMPDDLPSPPGEDDLPGEEIPATEPEPSTDGDGQTNLF